MRTQSDKHDESNIDVSVVIPTNRINKWLDTAVESVLIEKRISIEIILVLDGISRPSYKWIHDPRIVLIERKVSGGPALAMQDGVNASRGKYIARLDSDDVSLPLRMMMQKTFLDQNPKHVAVSGLIERIDENGRVSGRVSLPSGIDVRKGLLLYNFIPHSTLMFRKSLWKSVGGYNPLLRQMEDYDFLLRLGVEGPICQLNSILVQYRVHSGQTSRSAKAYGMHVKSVVASRNLLAKSLNQFWFATKAKNFIWRIAQHTRVLGFTKPKHLQ